MTTAIFNCRQFSIQQDRCAMKVGTDGMLLGAWADVRDVQSVLDVGTGTGLVALMLAQRLADTAVATIDALEIDPAAAAQAAENMAASPWAARLHVWPQAVQQFAQHSPRHYDLIVCNPPFWAARQGSPAANAARQMARQDAALTWAELVASVARLLGENGRFCAIVPVTAEPELAALTAKHGLFAVQQCTVHPTPHKPPHRLLMQWEWRERPCHHTTLAIETSPRHAYTSEYRQLTQAFYLHIG